MGLRELVARLERDAEARTDAILARAEADAAALRADAAAAGSARVSEQLAELRTLRREALDRELAHARAGAATTRLRAEHALVARVLERARALLDEPEQRIAAEPLLARLAAEALRHVEGMPAVVRCAPGASEAVRAAVAGRPDIEVHESTETPAGLIVEARDGSVTIDATLPALLERGRAQAAIDVLTELGR